MGWEKMKPTNKTCKECRKKIQRGDKSVLLATFDYGKVIETIYFHFKCYLAWLNRSIAAHAEKAIRRSAPIALKEALDQSPKMLNGILQNLFNPNDQEKKDSPC